MVHHNYSQTQAGTAVEAMDGGRARRLLTGSRRTRHDEALEAWVIDHPRWRVAQADVLLVMCTMERLVRSPGGPLSSRSLKYEDKQT